ncbi:MAG TPA: ATP-binding protein, partial [Azospirillaceae bacterium]|nr:ATP-binding protein [Azospirillaceae bacterium]
RFRDLIEGSIQGVFVHRGFHILFANEAYARMMGYVSIEEALAQPSMLDTIAPESRSKAERRYQRLMAGEVMPGLQRERNIRRDGSEMWVDLVDRVVTWNGEPAVQVTLMDITDRVQSERELEVQAAKVMALAEEIDAAREEAERNRRKAEAANAAKSRFLAVMSHELRTPMTGIMGVVDLLLGYAPRGEQRTLLRTLKDSAETLLTLLNDVLDFSKIEAGQLRLECIDFAPSRVVDDVVRLFSARASEKGLALSTHLPDGIPTAVRGDPTRLRQVLFNLVGNAIKFTEKGRIAIRLGCETADGGFTFRFEVQDTGIGLSAGQVATLFRPFTQADDSTTRRFGGTGLGLAICKRLVEAMRGTIDVTSTVGQGSSFWFTVTVAAGDPARVETETSTTAPQATGHPLRILLAEDNEVNRMVISAMLARMGHTVHGVGDGRQAVAAVAADDWDVVLMDMQMPEMDGSEATRLIRRMPPPKGEVPIVALSADALPEHRAHYMAGGLDGFLTKPVDWHDLAETVRRCQKGETPGVSPTHPAAPAQTADFPLLDPDRLNNLKESIGEEALLEMVEKLPPEFLKRLDALAAAVAAGDLHTAKRAAHQLRGLAGSFAATRVEAYARQIEEKAIDIAAVAAETGGLKEASRDTLAAFLALRAAGD